MFAITTREAQLSYRSARQANSATACCCSLTPARLQACSCAKVCACVCVCVCKGARQRGHAEFRAFTSGTRAPWRELITQVKRAVAHVCCLSTSCNIPVFRAAGSAAFDIVAGSKTYVVKSRFYAIFTANGLRNGVASLFYAVALD